MQVVRGFIIMGLFVCCASAAWGANSVVIDSQTVCAGATNVTIAVKITNEQELRHVTVPLEIRSVAGGASVSSLKMSWGDRMPLGREHPLGENGFSNQLYAGDCSCAKNERLGYGKLLSSDTLSHPVEKLPIGMLFSRFRMMGQNLKPGSDTTGSFVMTVDIGPKAGTLEIDTTCICPSHTLMFVDTSPSPKGIYPDFKKCVITVEACGSKGK